MLANSLFGNAQIRRLKLLSKLSMSTQVRPEIAATIRDSAGTKANHASRTKEALVPGVLYGMDGDSNAIKVLLHTRRVDLEKEMRERGAAIENTLYDLVLNDGSRHKVVPRQIQLNPLTDAPIAANFLRYKPGLRLRIPIKFINEEDCVDLKKGAYLSIVNQFLECQCFATDVIPSRIFVDMSKLGIGAVIRLSNLELPPGLQPAKTVHKDFVAGVIKGIK